jgi:hypothetical protein
LAGAQNTCDNTQLNQLSTGCISQSKTTPYCRQFPYDTSNPGPFCYSCMTDCDCAVGEYCSIAPNTFGKCKIFSAIERSKTNSDARPMPKCLPYTDAQLLDGSYPEVTKCADVFTFNGSLFIDIAGVCLNGKCKQCRASSPASFVRAFRSCGEGEGLQTARQCVNPGNMVSFPSYFWQPGVYYQDRVAVFTTIIALIMAGIAVLGLHGCRNSLRGYKKN